LDIFKMEYKIDNKSYLDSNNVKLSIFDKVLALFCCFIVKVTILCFKINGIKKLLEYAKSLSKEDVDYKTMHRAWYAVRVTPGTQTLRFACLENSASAALFIFLKKKRVHFFVGVKNYPMHSHSWLEYKGKPFNEIEETSSLVKIISI